MVMLTLMGEIFQFKQKYAFATKYLFVNIIPLIVDRPGEAGAVLQTAL